MSLFICIVTAVLLCITVVAAEVTIDVADESVWKPVESTLTSAQKTNLPRVDSSVCIGFILDGNAFEVIKKVDFGEGISNVKTQFSAALEQGCYEAYPEIKLLVRIDSLTGPVIAELYPDSAGEGKWLEPVDAAKVVITDAGKACKGEHSVFLVVDNKNIPDGYGYNVWPVTFELKQSGAAVNTETKTTANSSSSVAPSNTASAAKSADKLTTSPSSAKTSSPTAAKSTSSTDNEKDSNGPIIPIIIGSAVVLAGVVAVVIYLKMKKH